MCFIELYLERLLVESGSPELIEDSFTAQHSVDHSTRLLDIVVLHENGARQEFGVLDNHYWG